MIQQVIDFISSPTLVTFLSAIDSIASTIAVAIAGVSWLLKKYKIMFGSLSFLALALLIMAVDIGSEHFVFSYVHPDVRFQRNAQFHAMISLKVTVMIATLVVTTAWLSAIHPWLVRQAQETIRKAEEKQYEQSAK